MYDRWFTIALLESEFEQVWASDYLEQDCLRLCKPGFTKSHTTLDIDNKL